MSGDKLIFDLSQEIEGSPNVFIKKDWLNILDNMNQNYNSNQSVIDTSQLSNSSRYMDYRSGYLLCPMMMTLSNQTIGQGTFTPATAATSCDYALGLKNWYGSIVHSMTLDYNGTTIIQQTPYLNMWNSFRLMTSLSLNDITTQGSTIGFFPDDPLTWTFAETGDASEYGTGTCNNTNYFLPNTTMNTHFNTYRAGCGNNGFYQRQLYINFDPQGVPNGIGSNSVTPYYGLLPIQSVQNLWKGSIFNKVNATAGATGILQINITSIIYLKHLHSFFGMIPLLKGVFFKMTLNLNNTSVVVSVTGNGATPSVTSALNLVSVSVPVGGVCPLMIAAATTYNGFQYVANTSNVAGTVNYVATLQVGAKCLNSSVANAIISPGAQSIYLYVPAMTFNPVFEQAYLSNPVKQINYTDIYQYQVLNIAAGSPFNNLITNGISNLKSILILPFFSASGGATQLINNYPVYQSPFDTSGTGTTSPLCLLTNFNVVVSGQNAIYNSERYSFEQFNNQLYGCNSVNGGMTDGICSGLINSLGFETNYCYYYVNISRMLPVEESVPKSVQIIGNNSSGLPVDLWVFLEYGVDISIDLLTGSRV